MNDFESLTKHTRSSARQMQQPTYIPVIAEIGINHNGDLSLAKKLIDVAKDAGCDAVKFQKRDLDIVYSQTVLDSPRDSPWGSTQRDQKRGLEFGPEEYTEIDKYCKEVDMQWSASAWDLKSLQFIEGYNPPFHKVASAMVTNKPFLKAVANLGRFTLISTGMATIKQLDAVVKVFREKGTPFILLHTVSTYPTPEEDLNLAVISTLHERYGVPVGYSGHESSVSPSIAAATLGAVLIERHITLDRALYGSDQAASLEPAGLRNLVGTIRKIPKIIGDGVKDFAPGEDEVASKLRYWEAP